MDMFEVHLKRKSGVSYDLQHTSPRQTESQSCRTKGCSHALYVSAGMLASELTTWQVSHARMIKVKVKPAEVGVQGPFAS